MLFPSRYIEGTDYQHDIAIAVDLKHLPKVVLVRVLHYKITLWFFFFNFLFLLYSLKESHYLRITLKERGVMLHLCEERASAEIIWNSTQELHLFSLFHSFIQ